MSFYNPIVDFHILGDEFKAFVADPTSEASAEYASKMGLKVSHTPEINGFKYHIVRYDRQKMRAGECGENAGLLRSVIITGGRIVSLALPKALPMADTPQNSDETNDERLKNCTLYSRTYMEEGPMINAFFPGNEFQYEIATRSVVGAGNSYFDIEDNSGNKLTFRDLFSQAITESMNLGAHMDNNPPACYNFVLKHPLNRDVFTPSGQPHLICVGRFVRDDENGFRWLFYKVSHLDTVPKINGVREVAQLTNAPEELLNATMGQSYIFANNENGQLVRTKMFSQKYLELRQLRGTQPKLKFHYLTLRKQEGAITNYLKHFPQDKKAFSAFRAQIHRFTFELHRRYWECYVKKTKPLKEYEAQYRPHMYRLHETFKETRQVQTLSQVIRYVNGLAPAQLLYCLNWERHAAKHERTREQTNALSDSEVPPAPPAMEE